MKILNAIHAQSIGGVDSVFRNYTEILMQNNHEVGLLISANKYENYSAKHIFKLRNRAQILDFLKLLKVIFYFKPDIVICHSNRIMKWMRIVEILRDLFHCKKIYSIAINHGISFQYSLLCNYIININSHIHQMVIEGGFEAKKSFVLLNAIKVDQKFKLKTLQKPLVIGIYGRIEFRKGFDVLIKSAKILKENTIDFRLKIGGFETDPNYNLDTLKKIAKENGVLENCDFVGTVTDKNSFFENVDILCVPSREEPFGLVILEGFLFSTLVISSDTIGGKLLIKDHENGLLFTNENFHELAQKINCVVNEKIIYTNITRAAYKKLEDNFSFESLSREMEKILLEIRELSKDID